jgi:hypothetical protein
MSEQEWISVKKGITLPDDFLSDDGYDLNRDRYVIESSRGNGEWRNEYDSDLLTVEIVGAIVIGSKAYHELRYRLRAEHEQPYDSSKSTLAKLFRNLNPLKSK